MFVTILVIREQQMVKKITLVSGNKHKLREWKRIMPKDIVMEIVDLDLDEIQSMDLTRIIEDKAMRAYGQLGRPVVVEDVSASLDELGGLPGPFIKYFETHMGEDALYRLAKLPNSRAKVTTLVAYYDGKKMLIAQDEEFGTVVPKKGRRSFGFDKVFVPDGHSKTYSQMSTTEKDSISHRAKAIKSLLDQM